MKYLSPFFVLVLSIIALLFSPAVHAQTNPTTLTTNVSDITTDKSSVKGTIHIVNTTTHSAVDIHTIVVIQSPTKTGSRVENGKLIAFSETGLSIKNTMLDTFTLSPGQETTKSFTLSYPTTIPSTDYTVFVTLQDGTGKVLGIATNQVALQGSNEFLSVDTNSCKITADGIPYLPTDAPVIGENTQAIATCSFTNPTNHILRTKWNMTYQADPTITNVFTDKKSYTDDIITEINPHATKILSFSFPQLSTPQVYEGNVTIYNEQNQQITPEIEFRWTVPGPSARIRTIEADKKAYTTGETAHISVTADQSLDLFWLANPYLSASKSATFGTKLQDPSVAVQIYTGNKQLCGEKTQKVVASSTDANWPTQKIAVPITKDCQNPVIQAKIVENGKELAKQEQKYISADALPPSSSGINYPLIAAITIVLVAIIGGIVWYIKKKKTPLPPLEKPVVTILLLLFIIYALLTVPWSPFVKADNDNMGGGNGNTNEPSPTNAQIPTSTTAPGQATPTSQPGQPTPTLDPNAPTPTPYFYTYDYTSGMGLTPHTGENTAPGGLFMVRSWQYRNPVFMITHLGQFLFYPDGQMGTSITANPDGSYTVNLGTSTYQNGCGNVVACVQAFPEIDGSSEGLTINGVETNEIELYQQRGGTSFTAHANSFIINRPSATSCSAHTVKIKLALCGGYANTGGNDETTWWWKDNTLNTNIALYPEFKEGNNCVSTLSSVGTPMQTCFGSLEKAIPATTCTITPTTGPVITPTSAPTCNKSCSTDAECQYSTDGCTACLPNSTGGKSCQTRPSPSPTPILACNKSCTNSSDCALGQDGCTACLPNDTQTGKFCRPIPACGSSCTNNGQCGGGCGVCNAGKCSAFSPDMCKCDGMDFTLASGKDTFFPGDNVTFIAFGKVEGTDINAADLKSMKFSLFQSKLTDPNTATRIAQSADITPAIVQSDSGKVRYKVTWDHQIPTSVPTGTLFRIQADITCAAKAGVLGARTTTVGQDNYFTKLYDSIASLFSAGNVLSASDQQIQLNPFYPGAKIQEKSCKIIKFFFE